MLSISAHDLVTGTLVYLSIGSGLWVVLDGLGIIDNSFSARTSASRRAMVLATLMMILAWPWFVALWVRGMWRLQR